MATGQQPEVGAAGSQSSSTVPGTNRKNNPTANSVQRTRAWTGLWVVVGGDVAIALAAIIAVWKTAQTNSNVAPLVAILTSAFTAISTMTTAYFGIKTMSNTAQSFAPAVHAAASNPPSPEPARPAPPTPPPPADQSPDSQPPASQPPAGQPPANQADGTALSAEDEAIIARTEEPPAAGS